MNLIEKLNWRYATKKFDQDKKITDDQIDILAESLRLCASSFGLQPWKFIIVENKELKEQLVPASYGQGQVAEASHHVVFCAPKNFGAKEVRDYIEDIAETRGSKIEDLEGFEKVMLSFLERKNEAEVFEWAKNQVYIAMGSFLVCCAELGIDACPMEGIIPAEYDRILDLEKEELTTVVACPIGYRASDDKYASTQKVRFPLDKVVEKR
tara:strand:- start:169 stop:798 length:630 start_codon:yes stop_codon:yes gene_type:complete